MRKRNRSSYVFLFFSFVLAIAGLYLSNDAYYKNLSITIALNQVGFFKGMPSIVKNDTRPLPLYQENPILEHNKNLKAVFTGGYYNGSLSIRQVKITVYRDFNQKVELFSLVDARMRQ